MGVLNTALFIAFYGMIGLFAVMLLIIIFVVILRKIFK